MDDEWTNFWARHDDSFLGRIYTREAPSRDRAVYLSRFTDRVGKAVIGQSDWVIAGLEQQAYTFRFTLHSQSADRLHFMITGSGADQDKKLGISRNGYLGLYYYADVTDFLKLEALEWQDRGVLGRLRDHLGHQVKATHDPNVATPRFSYLNVQQGEPLTFFIERVFT